MQGGPPTNDGGGTPPPDDGGTTPPPDDGTSNTTGSTDDGSGDVPPPDGGGGGTPPPDDGSVPPPDGFEEFPDDFTFTDEFQEFFEGDPNFSETGPLNFEDIAFEEFFENHTLDELFTGKTSAVCNWRIG